MTHETKDYGAPRKIHEHRGGLALALTLIAIAIGIAVTVGLSLEEHRLEAAKSTAVVRQR
ncbi:MAG: hypothetical protein ACHP84_11965 [Caulobacterales bacterium]